MISNCRAGKRSLFSGAVVILLTVLSVVCGFQNALPFSSCLCCPSEEIVSAGMRTHQMERSHRNLPIAWKRNRRRLERLCALEEDNGIHSRKTLVSCQVDTTKFFFAPNRRDILRLSCGIVVTLGSFIVTATGSVQQASAVSGNTYPGGNQIKSMKSMGGLPKKIRSVCKVMDELQRDLMQERWDLVEAYPSQLRSYVPIFTSYTDTAFSGDEPAYKGLRVALRYEVGRFFAAVQRLKNAASRQDLDGAYLAYSDMALHFDRYLNVGNLYTYRDDIIDRGQFYEGIDDSALVYADPKENPALVRDLIVLVRGPDKGRTGIMIGIYPDGSNNCVVKLDAQLSSSGIREIRVVPRTWAALRLGEQEPDAAFLIPRKGEKG